MNARALYLRLEGPLQAWGVASNWTVRDTCREPTKSGIAGLLCCALGLRRDSAELAGWIEKINALQFGVREDIPGRLLKDYHTVGAGIGNLKAKGRIKFIPNTTTFEPIVSYRSYISDASFLAVLLGEEKTLEQLQLRLESPEWPLFLGRKCCPPSTPLLEKDAEQLSEHRNVEEALKAAAWRPRLQGVDAKPGERGLRAVIEANAADAGARPVNDTLLRLGPPQYGRRWVRETWLKNVRLNEDSAPIPYQDERPKRPDYTSTTWREKKRPARLKLDDYQCVVCAWAQSKGLEEHHRTYANVPDEVIETDLATLCKQCHFAVTMLEYEYGMDSVRIDPCDDAEMMRIVERREEIRHEQRARHLVKRR
ncbi:MAG TPA: type I-E CRISPR-associated protein Cas5/CasD [Planctomycetota bacterium]|jgi:CRISPR system Cascade subunit CasD